MGSVETIAAKKWPKQGSWIGQRCNVMFHYDAREILEGTYVRDDEEEPWVTIIRLDDGRYVLTTECQHQRQGE